MTTAPICPCCNTALVPRDLATTDQLDLGARYVVYQVETSEVYQYCNTERSAKIVTTRQNKEWEYLRNQGIYENCNRTFAYRPV